MMFFLQYLFWYVFCRYSAANINVETVAFMCIFSKINS